MTCVSSIVPSAAESSLVIAAVKPVSVLNAVSNRAATCAAVVSPLMSAFTLRVAAT